MNQDTIAAVATSGGMGAIAIVRISGDRALEVASSIFKKKHGSIDWQKPISHRVHLGTIYNENIPLDEVLLTVFIGPHSYTGEDVVEISTHGSTYIQQQLLQSLQKKGVRMAQPGEFTLRAFLQGKMDLSQAEAVGDLIASESAMAHKVALQQMRGGFSEDIRLLRQELLDFASLIELELDFAEEDVDFADRSQLLDLLGRIEQQSKRLIDSYSYGNVIKNGVQVALVGAPNAGKSTLLNALLNEDRAIVSDIAGTTRDAIEDHIILQGIVFRFVDTAGIRSTRDTIEQLGIQKTYEKIEQSDVVVYLYDVHTPMETLMPEVQDVYAHANGKPFFIIANKIDQLPHYDASTLASYGKFIPLSAKNKTNIENLTDALVEVVQTQAMGDQSIVTNQRHLEALQSTLMHTQAIKEGIGKGLPNDLLAQDLRAALHALGLITGDITPDDILGNIFSKFCIGK